MRRINVFKCLMGFQTDELDFISLSCKYKNGAKWRWGVNRGGPWQEGGYLFHFNNSLTNRDAFYLMERVKVSDMDPGPQDPVLWLQYTNTQGLQKSCGEKGMAWPLSKWDRVRGLERAQERELIPNWTGFYCFSGHITWRMVLIYYAQVHHRWLITF